MTERINGHGFRTADAPGTRRSEATKPAAADSRGGSPSSTATSGTSDTVSLTPSGLLLSKIEEVVQAAPASDPARVAAIKDALASGQYEIDDQRVADNLLRYERNLLG